MIVAVGTKIWAWVVKPGMIVRTEDGTQIEVEKIHEGYDTITYDNTVRKVTVRYSDSVEVLGYFNPENS